MVENSHIQPVHTRAVQRSWPDCAITSVIKFPPGTSLDEVAEFLWDYDVVVSELLERKGYRA